MPNRTATWALLAAALLVVATAWCIGQESTAAPPAALPSAFSSYGVSLDPEVTNGTWRSGGPYGGDVQALTLSPAFATDGLALAGGWRIGRAGITGGYGIVRTTDRGATWAPVFTGPPYESIAVFDLGVSLNFAVDRTAFAATDRGLLKSTDRGVTWERLSKGLPEPGNDPAVDDTASVWLSPDFGHDGTVFSALVTSEWQSGDLYRSTDRGDTWTRVLPGDISALTFARDSSVSRTVIAAHLYGDDTQLVRSTDGGLVWTAVFALPDIRVSDILETADHQALLLASNVGMIRLVPDGEGYLQDPVLPNIASAVNRLATAGDNIYAAAESGLFISLSFGRGWERYADTPEVPFRAVAPCPLWGSCHALMAGTHTGLIFTADDNLLPWSWLNGPHPLWVGGVTASPGFAMDGTLFAGTDHGVFRSTDRGLSWQLMIAGDPPGHDNVFAAIRLSPGYPADGTVFATFEDRTLGQVRLFKSTDRGRSWTSRSGIGGGSALALSPRYVTDRTVFVGQGDRLYKSTDAGVVWTSYPLTVPNGPSEGFSIAALAVSPTYGTDQTLFATGFGRARRSTDGGATWQALDSLGPSYGLAISPNYIADGTVWFTYRAIESPGGPVPESAVLRSTNRGANWSLATTGLPGGYEPFPYPLAASADYAVDRSLFTALEGQLVSGSRHSLYRSIDGGAYWTEIGPAPGNPDVFDLTTTGGSAGGLMAHLATVAGVWHYEARCEERLVNSSFELDHGWQLPVTAATATYNSSVAHSGSRSVQIGIVSGADILSYSSASQPVTIPAGVSSATLSFWWYPVSEEAPLAAGAGPDLGVPQRDIDEVLPLDVQAGDAQYVLLLDTQDRILRSLLWTRSNVQAWQKASVDLTPYRGLTLRVYFGVYNDGNGRRTAMYVDDASLTACWPAPAEPTPTATKTSTPTVTDTPASIPTPSATSTPTATKAPELRTPQSYLPLVVRVFPASPVPTPTSTRTGTPSATPTVQPTYTPTPTAGATCYDSLVNGGFETNRGWVIRSNPVLAIYAASPVHGGRRSMKTGISASGANIESYSPIEQTVALPELPSPDTLSSARLSFWRYRVYGDGTAGARGEAGLPGQEMLPGTEEELSAASFASDFFYVIAIHTDGSLDWLLVERVNDPSWRQMTIDVSRYAGRRVRFQFGTYNNGISSVSRMYLDDAALAVCPPLPVTPVATVTPSASPAPYLLESLHLGDNVRPSGIALGPAGEPAYVALQVGEYSRLGILQVEPSLWLDAEISLGAERTAPNGVALVNQTGWVAVARREAADLAVADVNTQSLIRRVPANWLPDGVIVSGNYGYVANFGNDTVTVFDPATLNVMHTVYVGHEPSLFAADTCNTTSCPTAGDVYLSLHGSNQVMRLRDGSVAGHYYDIPEPYGLAFDPTSRRLYIVNLGNNHRVTVLDVGTGEVVGTIDVGLESYVVAVNPHTGHLFVACNDRIKVYRTSDRSFVADIQVPPGAEEGIVVDPARDRAYVTSRSGHALSVIQDVADAAAR